MPFKIGEDTAQEVVRLHDSEIDASSIAQQLNLKKAQVVAIIAFFRPTKLAAMSASAEGAADVIEIAEPASELEERKDQVERIEEYSADPEPIPAIAVTQASELVEEALEGADESDNGIYIGTDSDYGDAQYWNPQDSESVPNPHMMIVGVSGSGKTYSSLCLTAELARRGTPTIIFDYAQSYEKDTLDTVFAKYVSIQEFRIGEDGISLNPLPRA